MYSTMNTQSATQLNAQLSSFTLSGTSQTAYNASASASASPTNGSMYPLSSATFYTSGVNDFQAPNMYNPPTPIEDNEAWRYAQLLQARQFSAFQASQQQPRQQYQPQVQPASALTAEVEFTYTPGSPLPPEKVEQIVANKTCVQSMYKMYHFVCFVL